jgi:mono/diheme cytochrome c family protein
MKKLAKYLAWTVVAFVVLALGAWLWAYQVAMGRYEKQWTVHTTDFPVPFPLSEEELAALRQDAIAAGADANDPLAGVDLDAIALERAVERGRHIVGSRTACDGCHAQDFGGMAIVDELLVGRFVAPNLTSGEGSVTAGFTANDWDRAVRHAVRHNGQSSAMPSQDYLNLSDRELSDSVVYIRSMPPVNRDVGKVVLGPVFSFLVATDPNALVAYTIDHDKAHAVEPPAAAPTAEVGAHLVQVCRGCHGATLSGGELQGDPNMPIVANLTPHESGLQSWSEDDFIRAIREGVRKDGSAISESMPWKAYRQMTDTEIKAIWAYLQTLPPIEKGSR